MLKLAVIIEDGFGAEMAVAVLEGFYLPNNIPRDISAAIDEFIKFFYFPAKDGKEEDNERREHENSVRAYSFKHDASLIFAAFAQQYPNRNISSLHWFEFIAMLEGLTDECLFSKIVGYRVMKIDGKMSDEYKKHCRKMKNLFALPDSRTDEEKEFEIGGGFWGM